jgi:hypothetical protein
MSLLAYHGRPWAKFDANDEQHRRWFAEFNANRTWKDCPVRFIIDDEQGDLITMIQRRLIRYYVEQEFNSKIKKKRQ